MKQHIKLGIACLARKTFDFEAAFEIYKNILKDLEEIENVSLVSIEDLVIEIEDAEKAAKQFTKSNIDALVLLAGTFHLGHLALVMNKIIRKPILLWGLNELPYDGGKIRLNSVCGINLDASNLYKAGVDDYHVVIGDEIDQNWIDAIRIKKAFTSARIGIAGYRAKGFFNLDVDELDLYKQCGVLVDHVELQDVFKVPIDQDEVSGRKDKIKSYFDTSGLSQEQLDKVAQLSVKLDKKIAELGFSAMAIRCWPEFAAEFGISPCAAMSLLQSEGKIITCEGDVLGALSMLAHKAIGADTPFLADFSQVDFEDQFALLWHCGVAPCNLWDGKCNRSLDTYFAGGKGVTADFVMKPGKISIARIDFARGEYRIFLQRAEGVPMEKDLKGTYMKAEFSEDIRDVLEKVIYNGIAHHISLVYGDYIEPFKIFAKLVGWKIIE